MSAFKPKSSWPIHLGLFRDGDGYPGKASKFTRCREYPSVFALDILCPVVYKADCCVNNACFAISNPWNVLIILLLYTCKITYAFESNVDLASRCGCFSLPYFNLFNE